MHKFNLHFSIHVLGSKYRELLKIFETEQNLELPKGCLSRTTFQSIDNLNELSYLEVWDDLNLLKESMSGKRYQYLLGAIKNLSADWSVEISEKIEINHVTQKIS